MNSFNRREFLKTSALCGAAAFLPLNLAMAQAPRFRFVHFTDLHTQPELGATEGVAMAVRKLLSLKPRPDFIIIGGDTVMDASAVERPRALLQYNLFAEAMKPLEMPLHYVVGNHDIYGWASKNAAQANDPDYGKKMYQEKVVKGPLHTSFDFGGWHFVLLDSIALLPDHTWRGEIDDAQMQWLKDDLTRTGKARPTILVTHVPLMTLFTQYHDGTTNPTSDKMIVRNGKEMRDIFKDYNVKAVLQGHTHVVEECTYTGTRYITSGAVCGEWWKGPRLGVHPEGFAVFDVEGDKLSWEYVPYGWKARTV
ncbi:MAG: metallophosphoesterase [Abitibacteriaceae bacterium]|nr:metallophosphoesterase [Abditibacteriaceae bacterium]